MVVLPPIPMSALPSHAREVLHSAKKARRFGTKKVQLLLALLFVLLWVLASSIIFMVLEKCDYFTASWFSFVTLSTIGYGQCLTIRATPERCDCLLGIAAHCVWLPCLLRSAR